MAAPASAVVPGQNIKFIAIGRLSDQLLLASYVHGAENEMHSTTLTTSVKKVVEAAKSQVQSGTRHKLSFDLGTLFFLSHNQQCIYAVVTAQQYPERQAFLLIEELISKVNAVHEREIPTCKEMGLTKGLKKTLKELATKFDDLKKIDKLHSVMERVDNVKDIMQNNVKQILNAHENLEELDVKADNLRANANQFQRSATDLKRMMYWRSLKIKIVVGVLVLTIGAYILVPILSDLSKRAGK